MKEINPRSKLHGTVRIPGSKSITHRAIIAASLAHGRSVLKDFLGCEDTRHTINAMREIGAKLSVEGNNLKIQGTGGELDTGPTRKEFYLGNSGTSLRLLLSVIALCRGEFFITGIERMLSRPVGPLVSALNQLGVDASCIEQNGCPPVLIRATGIRGGKVLVKGNQSSQFVSSLLLCGPYADTDIEIEVKGKLVSKPYVDITINVMEEFGILVEHDNYDSFKVPSGQKYRAGEFAVQGDASSASYFWAAAAVTGGTITTENINPHTTLQGDIKFIDVLERMGCYVKKESDRVIVRGGTLSGIDEDMSNMPDMVPTLAAIALFAKGRTIIRNVAHLRHKESDRLHALALEWSRLGARVEELPDGLIIQGGCPLTGAIVEPHNDHRLAMSLAIVGLKVPEIRIRNEQCVNKSFPPFWGLWDKLTAKNQQAGQGEA